MPVTVSTLVLRGDDRADTERGRCGSLRHTKTIPQCSYGTFLERVECVRDESRSLSHIPCGLQKPTVNSGAPVDCCLGHVSGLDLREPRDLDGRVGIEVLQAMREVPVDGGQVEELSEPARSGGIVVVDRDAEAGPDTGRGGAEEVQDESLDGGLTGLGEGGVEHGVVEADVIEAGGDEVDRREEVGRDVGGYRKAEEGDIRVGGRDAGDVRSGEVGLVGREGDDNCDGEGRRLAVVVVVMVE